MKMLLLSFLPLSFMLHGYSQVNMQGTIKPGSNPNTVDIYLKPSASFSQKDEAMTFTLAIPATVSPAPSLGSSSVTANGTGPVTGITGLQPEFIVNNLEATQREVVTSTETINGTSYYVFTFIFSGTAASNHDWAAGVEQQLFSIQFNGCTANCNLSDQLLVNLPNGGVNNISYWYVQPNTLGDITNYESPFYANAQSGTVNNGGTSDGSALSTLALTNPVSTYYQDADNDGYGNATVSIEAITQPAGYVTNQTDCNDNDNTISPAAQEVCDKQDNNCNGVIDEGLTLNTYYQDADGDGYGNASISLQDCSQLAGYVSNSQDCDDTNAGVHPNVIEICDSKDNNCNGQIDEGFTKQTYYLDADGDGFGDPVFSIQACSQPPGYVTTRTDNCPSVPNADQKDLDRDGLGDACDPVTNVAAALDALASDINRMVSQGWKNGLIAKLNEVKASCAQGNINAGANQLGAFINQVNAKRGKGLTDAQADDLIARANAVITAMNRGSSDCGKALKSVPGISFKELPIEEVEQHTKGITLQAIPNPSTSYFTLRVRSNGSNLPITLRVIDLYGRVVEDKVIDANCTVQIGASYRAGVYFAELIQRNEKVIVKLIKY